VDSFVLRGHWTRLERAKYSKQDGYVTVALLKYSF
jgi:hypothetical protein